MSLFSRPISVSFEDAQSGQVFSTVKLKPEQLPETFDLNTTLHIGDDEWSVVEARPATREECRKTGRLHLRLHRIERIDPQEILFGLPTIYDLVPAVGDARLSGTELALPDDDWRQLEFVSASLAEEDDAQIEAIRLIHQNHSRNPGWDAIHVRPGPVSPLTSPISLSKLVTDLGSPAERGLTYSECPSRIVDGFAFTLPDGLKRCTASPRGVAFPSWGSKNTRYLTAPDASSAVLREFARCHRLELVDWPRCARLAPDHPLFPHLLRGTDPGAAPDSSA